MIDILLKDCKAIVENRINELLPEQDTPYNEVINAARYSLLLGGKRIRPLICIEFCKLCGGKIEDALDFAVALEMIHTYSLIHDDLPCMDDDDMRRGNPSCHKKFGEDIALLAGDTLLTKAFNVAANANVPPERVVKAVKCLSAHAGEHGMIGGQVMDLKFEKTKPNVDGLTDMYSRKTADLLKAAAELGCIAAGANENVIKKASEFAYNLGLAFQVIDDILDCTADEAVLGKPIGSDQKNSKTTFVSLFGLERSREIAAELTGKALLCLDSFKGDTRNLKEITSFLLDRKY